MTSSISSLPEALELLLSLLLLASGLCLLFVVSLLIYENNKAGRAKKSRVLKREPASSEARVVEFLRRKI